MFDNIISKSRSMANSIAADLKEREITLESSTPQVTKYAALCVGLSAASFVVCKGLGIPSALTRYPLRYMVASAVQGGMLGFAHHYIEQDPMFKDLPGYPGRADWSAAEQAGKH